MRFGYCRSSGRRLRSFLMNSAGFAPLQVKDGVRQQVQWSVKALTDHQWVFLFRKSITPTSAYNECANTSPPASAPRWASVSMANSCRDQLSMVGVALFVCRRSGPL